jgi:hypothetical protein
MLTAAAAHDNDNDADAGMVVEVDPIDKTFNILIQYFASTSPPATIKSFLE